MTEPGRDQRDFFISFTSADADVATALNTALKGAGYSTWFHLDDKPTGGGIAEWMEQALERSTQMIAVCSAAYFADEKVYSRVERQAMFWEDPTNQTPLLLLVQVDACKFPRLIAQNERLDLSGMMAEAAGARLVEWLADEEKRKARKAAAATQARPPVYRIGGSANRYFTGRTEELTRLHEILTKGDGGAAITAVKGLGGIGKTTLAREYALRYGKAGRFAGVWWVDADEEPKIIASLSRLSERGEVGVAPGENVRETADAVKEWLGAQNPALPWLVIFDNAPDAATVRGWLPGGSARAIITSRNEYFDDIATPMSLDVWEEDTTIRFLLDRAQPSQGGEAEARALAKAIGNLPLAAEHAAAFLGQNKGVRFETYEQRLLELIRKRPTSMAGDYPDEVYASMLASLEDVKTRPHGDAALAILTICAFLAPEGVELGLLSAAAAVDDVLPDPPREALRDEIAREGALSALRDYSLLRQEEIAEVGATLHLHRLLREIAKDRLDAAQREHWGGAAVRMVNGVFPFVDTNTWLLCARLTPHATALSMVNFETIETAKAQDRLLNQAAVYLDVRGDRDGSIRLLRRSVEISEVVHRDKPLEIATALGNLASQLQEEEDDWDEAETLYKRTLEIKEVHLASDDPSFAITLSNLGGLHQRRKNFAEAVKLTRRAADIDKAAHGELSSEYATRLSNLGAIYHDWANETGDPALREKEKALKLQSLDITLAARGPRHPETTVGYNNVAAMHSRLGDMNAAATAMEKCVAIELSLGQIQHPDTQREIATLLHFWTESGQAEKVARLQAGDGADIVPIVQEIEDAHRAWVAEDPENRNFGPPSPVTDARHGGPAPDSDAAKLAAALEAAGVDVAGLMRRVKAGEITREQAAEEMARALGVTPGGD